MSFSRDADIFFLQANLACAYRVQGRWSRRRNRWQHRSRPPAGRLPEAGTVSPAAAPGVLVPLACVPRPGLCDIDTSRIFSCEVLEGEVCTRLSGKPLRLLWSDLQPRVNVGDLLDILPTRSLAARSPGPVFQRPEATNLSHRRMPRNAINHQSGSSDKLTELAVDERCVSSFSRSVLSS